MKKSKLLGINKSNFKILFILRKDKYVSDNILNFLYELKTDIDSVELENLNFLKIKDELMNLKDKNWDIDIFVGAKKIILLIRSKKIKQDEISKKIFKFFDMGK